MANAQPFLVYRDRLGAPSEASFLRRQYVGFTRLQPVWIGRTLLPGSAQIGSERLRLGGDGLLGPLRRLMFRHFGVVPPIDAGALAPVLHAQFARGGALALPIARSLQLRLFVTLHGGDVSKRKNWQRTVLSQRWPALIQQTTKFICVSSAVAETAAARGAPTNKLVVLPIGVEVAPRPPDDLHHDGGHLFVGRFVEKKGIAVLASAVRTLRAQGDQTPVTFVGDGPLRGLLEQLARDTSYVTLTGWLPPPEVNARMARANTLIVPSIIAADGDAEGLPSVIPEAMTMGCVVIGSDQGGIAEAIDHDRTGLLVSAGDTTALAAAMRCAIADSMLSARLGAAAYDDVHANLNAQTQSARLEALLLSQ